MHVEVLNVQIELVMKARNIRIRVKKLKKINAIFLFLYFLLLCNSQRL